MHFNSLFLICKPTLQNYGISHNIHSNAALKIVRCFLLSFFLKSEIFINLISIYLHNQSFVIFKLLMIDYLFKQLLFISLSRPIQDINQILIHIGLNFCFYLLSLVPGYLFCSQNYCLNRSLEASLLLSNTHLMGYLTRIIN